MAKCKYSKCNNNFEPRKSGTPQVFCSPECQWKNRDEIHPEYKKIQNDKLKLYKRLWKEKKGFNGNASLINKKCILCNASKDLIIHHIDGNNGRLDKLLNNNPENLVVLCRSCHPKVHNKWWRKEVYENCSL